jgi:hypothetical protein
MLVVGARAFATALERHATALAEIAPILNHAGCYAIHIGNELTAQALRVALARSPLFRRPLGGRATSRG